jgi:hypothetical protein
VILAVSLALIALLVATGGTSHTAMRHGRQLADAPAGDARKTPNGDQTTHGHGATAHPPSPAPTTSTTVATSAQSSQRATTTVPVLSTSGPTSPVGSHVPAATTTTVSPTTTTTAGPGNSQPADRTQATGVIDPPASMSHGYAFSGSGAMQVSVVWSGYTYLTMVVSCPNGSQSVGGTTAMAADLPNAAGACLATVTEPATESVALSYTITIGPTGA